MRSLNSAYLPRVDHLRFLAAFVVFIFHLYHHFFGHWQPRSDIWGFSWLVEGHTGVSLFFVLSGFLFMNIALGSGGHIRYGAFVRNRLLRIFPLFLFVFFVALSITRDQFQPQHLMYFAATNLGLAPTSYHFITGAAWTISVEFAFYLVFPFLSRFAIEQGLSYLPRLVVLLLLFKVGAYFVAERTTHMYFSTLLGRFDQFLIGMAAAQVVRHFQIQGRGLSTFALLFAVALCFGLIELQGHFASFYDPNPRNPWWIIWPTIEACAWAGVVIAYTTWRGHLPRPIERWLERGGEISYSIYLWHALVIFVAGKIIGTSTLFENWRLNFLLLVLVLLPTTWKVSGLSFATIEAPFLQLRGKYHATR